MSAQSAEEPHFDALVFGGQQGRLQKFCRTSGVIQSIAPNLWLIRYPLTVLGMDIRRNVAIIRLNSGELVIHSSAPFTQEDVAAISALGRPAWLVDAMLDHDSFVKEGREAFPDVSYLGPSGFAPEEDFPVGMLIPPPHPWGSEFQVLPIDGAPSFREHVFFHSPSRTLIVADLAFNFGPAEPFWTELLLHLAVGGDHHPGMSSRFKAAIEDEVAFRESMDAMFAWDFDRVIVGHGDVIESGGKAKIAEMLRAAELR